MGMKYFKKIAIVLVYPIVFLSSGSSEKSDNFVSLFDGKTLDGWVIPEKAKPSWRVVDGVLENDGIGPDCGELIWTVRNDYKDVIFKVDWRLPGEPQETMHTLYDYYGERLIDEHGNPVRQKGLFAGDSGVFLRGEKFDENEPESSQNRFTKAQFNIWSNPMGSGQVHGYMVNRDMPPEVRRASIPLINADKPLGEWNTMVITLKGEDATVVLNGVTVVTINLPDIPEIGAVGLQQHNPDRNSVRPYPIQFRNIYIKEL